MKVIKKIAKILIVIIIISITILVINHISLNIHYLINKHNYKETFSVSGNKGNYVPQGLSYSSKYNVALQTSYNSKHKVSRLYVTDLKTQKLIKELDLIDIDDNEYLLHVGGVTTDNNTVWITNENQVDEFSLEEIMTTTNNFVKSKKSTKLPIRGDFCLYKNNTLWIGDFFLNPFYKVKDNNPLLLAYDINNINYDNPKLIISLPKMVQGMEIDDNNEFLFTTSFTYLIKSNLLIYKDVLKEKPKKYILNGNHIPYYKFTKASLKEKIKLPPMAEGMFYKDNNLYILFESSSDSYKPALPKLKRVIIFNP